MALAASDERARIAREMHDVVAHGLSVIVVQADGARYAAGGTRRWPPTLDTIADTGREALTEMRRLLGLLRAGDVTRHPARSPAGGPRRLVEPPGRPAPTSTRPARARDVTCPTASALTAYRIVQEALTNVRKHAGPGCVRVRSTSRSTDDVTVIVDDDGRGASSPATAGVWAWSACASGSACTAGPARRDPAGRRLPGAARIPL